MKKRQQKCSFKLYPNQLKQKVKNGNIPIYLKLSYKGAKVEARLPERLDLPEQELGLWDEDFMRIKGKKESKLNAYLNQIETNWDKYNTECSYIPKHSLNQILDIILERTQQNTLLTAFCYAAEFINNNIEPSNEITEGTKRNYRKAVKHFSTYLKVKNLIHLPLKEFKHEQATNFKLYMGSPEVNNSPVSTSTNIKRIKTIFNEAINNEIITKNPFGNIKLTQRSKEKTPCLTINQIKHIINCEAINADKDLIYYRDLFLFGCFTGLSVSNIKTLSNQMLFPVYDKRLKLDTTRVKTNEIIIQIIPEPAVRIIEKYANLSKGNRALIFPNFCTETFNEKLKLIGVHAGINIKLSTKISRTSCKQLIDNVGYFDIVYKRAYFGWSSRSDIMSVYTTIVDEVLLKNTERVEAFLFSNLDHN